jgi:hypothetical protein
MANAVLGMANGECSLEWVWRMQKPRLEWRIHRGARRSEVIRGARSTWRSPKSTRGLWVWVRLTMDVKRQTQAPHTTRQQGRFGPGFHLAQQGLGLAPS